MTDKNKLILGIYTEMETELAELDETNCADLNKFCIPTIKQISGDVVFGGKHYPITRLLSWNMSSDLFCVVERETERIVDILKGGTGTCKLAVSYVSNVERQRFDAMRHSLDKSKFSLRKVKNFKSRSWIVLDKPDTSILYETDKLNPTITLINSAEVRAQVVQESKGFVLYFKPPTVTNYAKLEEYYDSIDSCLDALPEIELI